MGKIFLFFIIAFFSCKAPNIESNFQTQNILAFYSKGSCSGTCPVYDVLIYENGTVVYNGIDHVQKKGMIRSAVSQRDITDLKLLLEGSPAEFKSFRKAHGKPLTTIKYNKQTLTYHASKVDGSLKQLNTKLEDLVAQITTK